MKLPTFSQGTSLETLRSEASVQRYGAPEAAHVGVSREISMVDESSLDRESLSTTKHGDGVRCSPNMCLYKSCLHPRLSLKNQLFLSFGIVTTVSLLFVVATSMVTAAQAGDTVKSVARDNLEHWSEQKLAVSARIVAETVTKSLEDFEGMSTIMTETIRDRFVGYPDHPGYEDDSLVPFRDTITGRNIYPLKANELLPLSWKINTSQVTEENSREHFQSRADWYEYGRVNSMGASYRVQGVCNPAVTDPSHNSYYPNCTDANNDISVGGSVQPTSTANLLHQKASDFAGAILKPLFEAHSYVKVLGFYFANSGAGMEVTFPAWMVDGGTSYISAGCDWMSQPNPLNASRPIGTPEEIARCHANGTKVFNRDYNPLERKWCQEQALDPSKSQKYGPYKDAFSHNLWLLTIGRSAYDRVTGELIGCTLADISVDEIGLVINEFRITDKSEIAFVRWDDRGTVVASKRWNSSLSDEPVSVADLGIGLNTKVFAEMKENLSYDENFRSQTYEPLFPLDSKVFAFYPVPVPPKNYDPKYEPEFAIILALEAGEIFEAVNELDAAVEETVWSLRRTILIAGIVGLLAVILCIYAVSIYLTIPMKWMNDVGSQIVQSIGSRDKDINFEHSAWLRYSPRTEISALVQQFQTTVKRFSGHGTAKLHTYKGVEVKNPFEMHHNFHTLYSERSSEDFKYNYQSKEASNGEPIEPGMDRRHIGHNIVIVDSETTVFAPSVSLHDATLDADDKPIWSSPLFWWILVTITVPLLITMVVISVYVTLNIASLLPQLVYDVEEAYVDFEEKSLYPLAKARAAFAASVIAPTLRDLHLVSRVAGWLFFGGLQKAESVTKMENPTEACKWYGGKETCPAEVATPCDCRWNHVATPSDRECKMYDQKGRYLQETFWFGSKLDTWPNGDINSTSYPEVAYSQNSTAWWGDDITSLPGSELGFNATGSGTTYETILSLSAMAVVQIPVYNYRSTDTPMGQMPLAGTNLFSFEDTGIFGGYAGCDRTHAYASMFRSTEQNGAAEINSTLCPLGKFGYDPRCRPHYKGGREKHELGEDPLYVSPPYTFATVGNDQIGQTAVVPLRDQVNGTLLGMVLMNLNITPVTEALSQEETPLSGGGFHVLISTAGEDAIVAPGVDLRDETQSVVESVLPYDNCNEGVGAGCDNIAKFESIVTDMRAGKSNSTRFTRTTASGDSEVVFWAYHNVDTLSFNPINSSDFSSGVTEYQASVLSLALALTEPGVHQEFSSVEEDLDRTVRNATIVLVVLISLALVCVFFLSSKVTISIIRPVSRLLDLVTSINNQDLNDDIPEIHGGCREVTQVHDTFHRLYMVVRFANSAFFSGDLSVAYQTLRSALDLFTKLHNEKAIGIANNNLGNTMLTMYRTMKKTQASSICGLTKRRAIESGISYFKKTIDSGEAALARINREEGWSTNYLIFMQQLSNRYFNRAMFLLSVKEDHPDPDEAERQGFTDLATSKDMDREVVDNGDSHGFKGDHSVYFELLIGRIKGILHLLAMGYDDEWGIDELFEDASSELADAMNDPGLMLFRNIQPAGQMQRLDATLIEHSLFVGDHKKAALVAIRMLIEDEFLICEPANWAIKALIDYIPILKDQHLGGVDRSDVQSMLFQYKRNVTETRSLSLQVAPRRQDSTHGNGIMMRESAKQSTYGDISMELF